MKINNYRIGVFDCWDDDPLGTAIIGALKNCVNEHGPIEKGTITSAAKRVYGVLKSFDNGDFDKIRLLKRKKME